MKIKQIIEKIISISLTPIEIILELFWSPKNRVTYSPIFIVGAPRSGSSLIYKAIIQKYGFGYLSNFNCLFYKLPLLSKLVEKLSRIKINFNNYDSRYGVFEGIFEPSECGNFWYQWFPKGKYVYADDNYLSVKNISHLGRKIISLSNMLKKSLIFKNLYNSMRIAAFYKAFPEAIFIVCRRDIIENAISILNARNQTLKSNKSWWSVPPKEIDNIIQKTAHEKAFYQVKFINEQVFSDLDKYFPQSYVIIDYEEFCENTSIQFNRLSSFFRDKKIHFSENEYIPKSFLRKSNIDNVEDRRILMNIMQSLENNPIER